MSEANLRPHDNGAIRPLRVEVGVTRHYEVHVRTGLLAGLPDLLARRSPGARMAILTDAHVEPLYARPLRDALRARQVAADLVVVPPGDRSKSFGSFLQVIERLYDLGFDRRALLVNVGGGLVCDLGGFVAASYMRGVSYVNVPTTLLAQHDAAIGGKVAVNTPWAKNFVGAFHHPDGVFIDPATLLTLPARELAAGAAEAIKVAMIGDRTLFERMEQVPDRVIPRPEPAVLADIVWRACRKKIELLAADPLETDLRRVLNLGHTYGHALETEMEYTGILHGEAVSVGLLVATAIAARRRLCSPEEVDRIYRLLRSYGLPPALPAASLRAALRRLAAIRLIRANQLHYVLPVGIGRVEIVDEVGEAELAQALEDLCQDPRLRPAVQESAS